MSASPTLPGQTSATTTCPFSGRETGLERVPDPELGSASLDEVETLVRNEWRRRLGPHAYLRDHPPAVVRAVLVYALAPESPVRESIVRQLVLWELAMLGGWGLGRAAVGHEFQALARAVRSGLRQAGVCQELAERMADAVDHELADVLAWDLTAVPPSIGEEERDPDGSD